MKRIRNTLLSFFAVLSISHAQVPDFGVQTVPLTLEKATELKLKAGTGTEVVEVFENSDADEMGLMRGDIVTQLGKRPLRSVTGLSKLLAATADVGDKVELKWLRDGEAMTGSAELTQDASLDEIAKLYEANDAGGKRRGGGGFGTFDDFGEIGGFNEDGVLEIPGFGAFDFEDLFEEGQAGALRLEGGAGNLQGFAMGPDGEIRELEGEGVPGVNFQLEIVDEERFGVEIPSGDGTMSHLLNDDGEHILEIRDADGEVEWEGSVTEDTLDKIPEAHRETARQLLKQPIKPFGVKEFFKGLNFTE